ncbi:Z1 domain-containing protein [Halobacillus sp. A5]|uniref:Z1 domain-containing protein n=1 Tax=Halobacillus sp. A5 TaxID=2880263 RepID=UPI0020A6B151|nr:Z1 domain-containing protein [Halobacillus sp. A5]MCP3027015.1 Z1 domain-containing protein [Halobacillus sp. A5]
MIDIHLPAFDDVRRTVKNILERENKSWEVAFNGGPLDNSLDENLRNLKKFMIINDSVTEQIWIDIVKDIKLEEEQSKQIEKINRSSTILSQKEDNKLKVPDDERSSWMLYRKHLLRNGMRKESVDNIEASTLGILKKLNADTTTTGPIKGLVIGQVQSGKTASMAALMAMASDWGWNTFIVLSGMIENLRKQTERRLFNDLHHAGNNNWEILSNLSTKSPVGDRLQDLHLYEGSSRRYLNICLKNRTRLENLISWLKADTKQFKNMKILVIDDEADQASINTKEIEEERAKINELIVNLVESVEAIGARPKAMNFISYTATPYSNFLNESSRESLYPKDFIAKLPVSDEFFGPKQIFGVEGTNEFEGMDIIRDISSPDHLRIQSVQEGKTYALPESLKESIAWFLISTATIRYYNIKMPVSMLIHTSQKQYHHKNVANAVEDWITKTPNNKILSFCKELFEKEVKRFNIDKFRAVIKNYPIPNDKINDYPHFIELESLIGELIKDISHIKMDREGELKYRENIHLCIDNCSFNGVNDENMHVRLAYPEKRKLKELDKAPAFIIVGGSTLSRGLTIEGLVSTYFLRASNAGDSLMQMGRWFGYRKGYELLPRIWMTKKTYEKFIFLTNLEEELREELEEFEIDSKSPSEYGPRVKNTPKVSWLRVTAKNKMQNAEEVEMDFTGSSIQTIHFENKLSVLKHNINVTEGFLNSYCSRPERSIIVKSSLVYRNIEFQNIKEHFLMKMGFSKKSRTFNQIEAFTQWFEKVSEETGLQNWNVIIGGAGEVEKGFSNNPAKWNIGGFNIGKVERSVKSTAMDYPSNTVNIGVLRAPSDVLADIRDKKFIPEFKSMESIKKSTIKRYRKKYDMSKTPQLIIYRIKRDSVAHKQSKTDSERINLNFAEDIIGVCINIPGSTNGKPVAKGLRVKIENEEIEE